MSTRCSTWFVDSFVPEAGRELSSFEVEARVYRHSDGYPEGAGVDLRRFFEAVAEQCSDTRFDDPTYLAAKYVVYLAGQFARHSPLDFLSVGVVGRDPGDIEFVYVVDCGGRSARPALSCFETADGVLGAQRFVPSLPGCDEDLAQMDAGIRLAEGSSAVLGGDDLREVDLPVLVGIAVESVGTEADVAEESGLAAVRELGRRVLSDVYVVVTAEPFEIEVLSERPEWDWVAQGQRVFLAGVNGGDSLELRP